MKKTQSSKGRSKNRNSEIFSVLALSFLWLKPLNGAETFPQFKNWGLVSVETKADIRALDAWKIEEGNHDIIVAVIDTGVDFKHRALAGNMWHDPKQTKQQVFGWNFVSDQPNPNDTHGHGTHVAGIIGAVPDAFLGVSGVAHRVSIMPVKYYSDANPGPVNLKNTIKAINYAIDNGARIINYSGGGPEFSKDEYEVIKKAEAKGVLFVAAAGNEHQNIDKPENYYYPSAYHLSNIISVAATDSKNMLLPSSNWGKVRVDVAAPGERIFSTLPGGKTGYMSGTSQATAFVSGIAALLLAQNPKLTPQQIKALILRSVDTFPQLRDKVASGGRVNAFNALRSLKEIKTLKIHTPPVIAPKKSPWVAEQPNHVAF